MLPEVAATLRRVAVRGASEFATGAWAKAFVALVESRGGGLTLADLSTARATFEVPLRRRYRGHEIYASAGWSFGGRSLLTNLAVLEHADLAALGPIERSSRALELLVRTQRAVSEESWVFDPAVDAPAFERKLNERADAVWDVVRTGSATPRPASKGGTHSSSVIVVDDQGGIAVGTHTIEALNWGEGLFVGGIPLGVSTANMDIVEEKLIDPLSVALVYDAGRPTLALAVYGTGLHPADVQVLTSIVDLGRTVEDAVLAPRLGYFTFDITKGTVDTTQNLLDLRVPPSVVCRLGALGATLRQAEAPGYPPGILDLGFPTVVQIEARNGVRLLTGMTPELMSGVAAGD